MEQTADVHADPSPAPDVHAASSPAAAVEVPKDPQAYQEWRRTGKLPAAKEPAGKPKEDSTTSQAAEGDKPKEKTAPASAAGKEQEPKPPKPRSNAETRLNEILEDLKRAGLSPVELKTFKRQAQAQEAPPKEQPKAAPEHTDKPAGKLEPPVEPKAETWTGTWEELDAARSKYFHDLADYTARKAIADYQAEQQERTAQQEMQGKLAEAKQRYGDEAEATIGETGRAFFTDPGIPAAVKALVEDSPVMVDLLYTIGSKAEDLAALVETARRDPGAAIRKIVLLERLVTEELAKGSGAGGETPARGEDGKFKAPEKKTTQAPPPPKEVSGRGAAPPDEVESAASAGDFSRFRAAANRRDMARARGQ